MAGLPSNRDWNSRICTWIVASALLLCMAAGGLSSVAMVAPAEPNVVQYGKPAPPPSATKPRRPTSHSHTGRQRRNARWGRSRWGRPLLVNNMQPEPHMQEYLLQRHNYYRSLVPASNMQFMYWSPALAASAQRHAATCDFNHSRNRRNVGENIWAAPYGNYTEAVWLWYREVDNKYNPYCNCPHHYKHCCGHYTQVVWAPSRLLGCGAAQCRDVQGVMGRGMRYVLVCHYNPQGNTVRMTPGGTFAVPAFRWRSEGRKACSECPKGLKNCWNGALCY